MGKILTEEQKKAKREAYKRWYDKVKDTDEFRKKSRDKAKKWAAEHKETKYEYNKTHREKMKKHYSQYNKDYREEHLETIKQNQKKWYTTPLGRAKQLIGQYKRDDVKKNRGVGDMTAEYLANVIFPQGCYYCGETDFTKLGAYRIDNNKPHNINNCVCSCGRCNREKGLIPYKVFKFIKLHPEINPCELEVQVHSQLQ